jgi:hypothetical protein
VGEYGFLQLIIFLAILAIEAGRKIHKIYFKINIQFIEFDYPHFLVEIERHLPGGGITLYFHIILKYTLCRLSLILLYDFKKVLKNFVYFAMILKNFIAHGIDFDWIGGDGLYGHTYEFARGLDERNLSFVLDVHKNQQIYLQAPNIYVPEQKSSKGRKPTRLKADCPGKRVDKYVEGLPDEAW